MSDKITFEDFACQHNGLCLIMETYNLTVDDLRECLMSGITERLKLKAVVDSLSEEDKYLIEQEQGYYGK